MKTSRWPLLAFFFLTVIAGFFFWNRGPDHQPGREDKEAGAPPKNFDQESMGSKEKTSASTPSPLPDRSKPASPDMAEVPVSQVDSATTLGKTPVSNSRDVPKASGETNERKKAADEPGWRPASAMEGSKNVEDKDVVRVRTVASEPGAIALEYAMPALQVIPNPADKELSIAVLGNAPWASGGEGKPILPVVPCYVALPPGQTVESVEVVLGTEVAVSGSHRLGHGQRPVPIQPGEKSEVPPDPAVYGSDEPWPRGTSEYVGLQSKRGAPLVVVNLNPVKYQPKSGKLSYYTGMQLKVKTKPMDPPSDPRLEVKYRPDRIRPLSAQVDNPQTLEGYPKP